MKDHPEDDAEQDEVADALRRDVARKRRARRRRDRGALFGLGTFGLVGWSVSLPTVAGLALGIWLDGRVDGTFSWTLALLMAGICLGCANAWYWISQESRRAVDDDVRDGDGGD